MNFLYQSDHRGLNTVQSTVLFQVLQIDPEMENADKDDPSGIGSSGEGPSHMFLHHVLSRVVTL